MKRRTLFAVSGSLATAVLAGCFGGPEVTSRRSLPSGMAVETQHRTRSHLEEADVSPSGERPRSEQVLFTDEETAMDRLVDDAAVQRFTEQTDFSESVLLVVVAAAWPSGYEMSVRRIERVDAGLQVSITVTEPASSVGDDAAVHSLAARITDEDGPNPDQVSVDVNGERTGTATPAG